MEKPFDLNEPVRGALARGYTHEKNANKILDNDLIEAMEDEIIQMISELFFRKS